MLEASDLEYYNAYTSCLVISSQLKWIKGGALMFLYYNKSVPLYTLNIGIKISPTPTNILNMNVRRHGQNSMKQELH